jgi:uncharacterized membrane protein
MTQIQGGSKLRNNNLIRKLTLGGLMIALVFVTTFSIKIPVPFTQGYIHGGDSMIFVAAILLGWKYGALAGGLGSALADLIGGYTHWVLPTLIIKTIMGALIGLIAQKSRNNKRLLSISQFLGMLVGGTWMVLGYYGAAAIIYGSFIVPIYSIPWNILQFAIGLIIACLIIVALKKTSIQEYLK